ncbi:MAG: restriction endonuclease [Clostridia bacterium]|nr:restriction endonuclease [Clostridia bacterium]
MPDRRRRQPEHGLLWHAADGLLTLVDWICRGLADAGMLVLKGAAGALRLLFRAAAKLSALLLRLIALPFVLLGRALGAGQDRASQCLRLTGEEFEEYCALILKDNGFRHVELTPMGGDQGVDILAVKDGECWAIQCKNYSGAVGNFAVQEAYAGREYYGCDRAAVICPGEYTGAARELAESTGVELWAGDTLSRMMKRSGRRPRHRA